GSGPSRQVRSWLDSQQSQPVGDQPRGDRVVLAGVKSAKVQPRRTARGQVEDDRTRIPPERRAVVREIILQWRDDLARGQSLDPVDASKETMHQIHVIPPAVRGRVTDHGDALTRTGGSV